MFGIEKLYLISINIQHCLDWFSESHSKNLLNHITINVLLCDIII